LTSESCYAIVCAQQDRVTETAPGNAEENIVKELPVNRRIRAKEVLLIGEAGEQFGVMPLRQALETAKEQGLDLVEVSPTSTPPVCRLLDYGKYKYLQAKKEREARKSQRSALLREIRVKPKIHDHDLDAKVRSVKRLLAEGDKVKVTIRFRGREITRPELGKKVLQQMLDQLKDVAIINQPLAMEQRSLSLVFSPRKQTKQAEKVSEVLSDAKA
jgi:translation initiation factor IF-3